MMNLANHLNKFFMEKAQLLLGFFIIFALFGCSTNDSVININGFTMGTTYSIKIADENTQNINRDVLKSSIDSVLTEFNQQMSTYVDDSEISKFNNQIDSNWHEISDEFYTVLDKSNYISQLTNGAFDITIGPIVQLWGFNNTNRVEWQPPSDLKIDSLMDYVGHDNIEFRDQFVRKLNMNTVLDLNAIAKGYGVDIVFEFLSALGHENILVEIGGEIRCQGLNHHKEYWKVGIDKPILETLPGTELQAIINIDNSALATSGDYRNYFIYDDKIYSHTVDPKTGYPIENGIASASVIAPNCMMADALATALMVMGIEGMVLIENIKQVEALLIERKNGDEFRLLKSSGWDSN